MLSVTGLRARYGSSPVLHGVDLRVAPGEIVALLGRNGAGRSTTLKAIMGMVEAQGELRWRGESLLGLPVFEIARRGIGYVPEGRDIFPGLSVEQNLAMGERRRAVASGAPRWDAATLFRIFPQLAARRRTAAGVLSGGEQQMLALARTLMGDPDLLLVDEPTEGLAPAMVDSVAELLALLRDRGVAVLLVEQKLEIAMRIAARCCVMGHGRIVFEGTPAALQADAGVLREWLAL